MKAENGVIDDSSQRKIIKQLSEVNPDIGVSILPQALVIEPVDLGDLSYFVITSQNSYSVLKSDFQSNQQRYCFNRVVPTVNIIAHEEVVGVWRLSANFKKFL